jgi:hypothetical protein
MQQWQSLVETEQDEGVAEWMHKFYDILLSNWHDQVCVLYGNLVETEQDEGVAEWMHKFYDILLSNWHDQVCVLYGNQQFLYFIVTRHK